MKYLIAACNAKSHSEQHAEAVRLLGQLVGEPCAVEHDAQGVPFLPAHPNWSISISHCHRAVAVALCEEKAVGIDIECRRRVNKHLIERVCTDAEQTQIAHSADPTMAFLQLWTRKEAVLKCLHTGIKGFGSLQNALGNKTLEVRDIPCGDECLVAAVAVSLAKQ